MPFVTSVILPVLAVLIVYLELPNYLFKVEAIPVTAALSPQALGFCVILCLLPTPRLLSELLFAPISRWIFFYLGASLLFLYWAQFDELSLQVFEDRVRGCIILWVSFAVFARSSTALWNGLRLITVGAVLVGFMNIWEFWWPGSFVPEWSQYYVPGRSATVYLNPNGAGSALIFGLLVGLLILPLRFRPSFVTLLSFGVITTYSRAAILLLGFFVLVIFPLKRILTVKQYTALFLVGLIVFSSFSVFEFILQFSAHRGFDGADLVHRIESVLSFWWGSDGSTVARIEVGEAAWQSFLVSPLVGNGLTANQFLIQGVGSHNIYLQHLAQHGFLGLVIYPSIVFICCYRIPLGLRSLFILFYLFMGLFSHNQLDSYHSVFGLGLAGALSYRESKKFRQGLNNHRVRSLAPTLANSREPILPSNSIR